MMRTTPIKEFKADALTVRVHATANELARAAAAAARRHLQARLAVQEKARVIFACATSQVRFLEYLMAFPDIEWQRVCAFHMDEYLGLPADHCASFRRFLSEKVVARVHPGVVQYLNGDALEPIAECDRYGQLLLAEPIDLCCLGIGENGHIAFNDPPVANFQDPRAVKLVKLDEACRQQQVGEGFYPRLSAVPQYALTLTIPMLCRAAKMICVVPDARKAQAVKDTLLGDLHPACPASYLRTQPQAELYLDQPAFSMAAPSF
jgi:glucosamine-6-phosphate deaminase